MTKKSADGEHRGDTKADPKQNQTSEQSMCNPSATSNSHARSSRQTESGVGSSQGQDAPSREDQAGAAERPSAGTPDLPRERGLADTSDVERGSGGSEGSLVNDPSGAFKERP